MYARAAIWAQCPQIGNATLKTRLAKFRNLWGQLCELFPTCHNLSSPRFSFVFFALSVVKNSLTHQKLNDQLIHLIQPPLQIGALAIVAAQGERLLIGISRRLKLLRAPQQIGTG